jgi:magnesium chelatase family protein
LDRFDLHVEVGAIEYEELSSDARGEPSLMIRQRVATVRDIQETRYARRPAPRVNARMTSAEMDQFCALDKSGRSLLRRAMTSLKLSARAHDRILRVARTIADLTGSEPIEPAHLAEAIQYRCLDRG